MYKMKPASRIIIAIASLSLVATFFLPVWFIFLIAPQYPEGLTMNIWFNKITGQVDIINGLNHYIGMQHINASMFPEFTYLVYIVGIFIAFGLLIAITGNRKMLFAYLILTLLGASAAIYDFYQWGYKYGHNLDPKAAIQVPGLYYQPPVIGHKTLLNFDAYSYPDSGGWIVVIASMIFFGVWLYEWLHSRKKTISFKNAGRVIPAAAVLALFTFSSCKTNPEPFVTGKDNCEDCRMTIMDTKFGGEIITKKGRIYKFDDPHCLAHYIKSGKIKETEIAQTVFMNFENGQNFLDATTAYFVVSQQLKSPMNSNAAAFANKNAADRKATETTGVVKDWKTLFNTLN